MHRPSVQAARVAVDKARTSEFRELVQQHTQLSSRKRKHDSDTSPHNNTHDTPTNDATSSSAILPPVTPPSAFTQSALLIRQSIGDIHRLLASQQHDYLDPHRHLTSAQSRMTDTQRNTLELSIAQSIAAIATQLDTLKQSTAPPPPSFSAFLDAAFSSNPVMSGEASGGALHAGSVWVHRSEVVLSLYDELRRVTELMAWMKDERRRQKQEEAETMHPPSFRQYSQQAATGKDGREERKGVGSGGGGKEEMEEEKKQTDSKVGSKHDEQDAATTNQWSRLSRQHNTNTDITTLSTTSAAAAANTPPHRQTTTKPLTDPSLTAAPLEPLPTTSTTTSSNYAQQQQLEQENAQLFSSLSTHLSSMHQAESTAQSISQLLTQFHSKVLEQSEQIERIEGNVVDSVALVERGVEQLRKAASRGASFRMMIMFMIVTLSFCLLFLDWYYP